MPAPAKIALEAKPPHDPKELVALLNRAQKGDDSTLPALRELMRDPYYVEVLGGNLARQAETGFIEAAYPRNLMFQEALRGKLEMLRKELAGPDPTPIERLLVGRVVACWLQVQEADLHYARCKSELTLAQGDYHQRRMDRAHRRYLSALRTLAQVRRLALPVLIGQVNIAGQQVILPAVESGRVVDSGSFP